ncbi:MAG TPA: FTR1 family protein [Rhodanobacteraceae bacterium]|nr:FTR1 family protein [Rhodanobacteraceae bacterium]
MFGVALLVFREVLEAALIVTVVAAATRGVARRGTFIGGGIALGVIGAIVVAMFAGALGGTVGGAGQELFNAGVLLAAVVMIGWHVTWMSSHGKEMVEHMQQVTAEVKAGSSSVAMLLAVVALAVLREGSEVVLFLYGMAASGAGRADLLAGVLVGLASGVAVGFALYFGLLRIPIRHFFTATNWMLVLLAAGLASSAAGFLIQANWLPALGSQLWDTSWLLSNRSLVGQAVHVLVGYEARPAGMQLVFWMVTAAALFIGMRLMTRYTTAHGGGRARARQAASLEGSRAGRAT